MSIQRGYFSTPNGQVHYRIAGRRGARPLILLHQSPLSGAQFEAVLPRLAQAGWEALALDMPGFGMSDPLPGEASLEGYAAILPEALSAMGWRQAAVVGHHTGAVVGAVHAVARPDQVQALVLNGFPLLTDAERAHFATFYFGPKAPQADGSHLLTAWQNRLRSTPGWTDLQLMHRYTVEGLVSGATNWMAFPLILQADLSGVLRRITVPTLLFTNTGEDLYEATRRTRELRPEFFAYAELQGGSHDIVDEQPEAWVRSVTGFLEAAANP